MAQVVAALVFIIIGAILIIFRRYNAERIVDRRNSMFGTRHGAREAGRGEVSLLVAGIIFIVVGLLIAVGVFELQPVRESGTGSALHTPSDYTTQVARFSGS